MRTPYFWRSIVVEGRKCNVCHGPAYVRVREIIEPDDPGDHRMPLAGYLCRSHYTLTFGVEEVEAVERNRPKKDSG